MECVGRVDGGVSRVREVGEEDSNNEIGLDSHPPVRPRRHQNGYMCPWGGEHHTLLLFPPARELPETVQKVIWEGAKGVIVVPV